MRFHHSSPYPAMAAIIGTSSRGGRRGSADRVVHFGAFAAWRGIRFPRCLIVINGRNHLGRLQMQPARALAIATLIATSVGPLSGEETGFLNRSISIEGTEYRYQIYVPPNFQRSTSWPVILVLHGGGGYGSDGVIHTRNGIAPAIRSHPERFPSIVVFPQSPSGTVWGQPLSEQIALNALDKSIAEFNGDASRIYLTGLSGGGYGAWALAYHHPDRFAALIVVAGYVREMTGVTSGQHYRAIVAGDDPYQAVAARISRLPTWIFHGDADGAVPVEEARHMAAALKAVGADVQYTELAGVGHPAWDPAYGRADLFTWLFKQKRR